MNRKNVSSVNNLPCTLNFVRFFKQKNSFISSMNEAIKQNNASEVGRNGVCYYNYYLGENNLQLNSQDGQISFYSVYDDFGMGRYSFGSFQNPRNNSVGSFLLQSNRHDRNNSFTAKYLISTPNKDGSLETIRGIQMFEKGNVFNMESTMVTDEQNNILSASTAFVYAQDGHLREEKISSSNPYFLQGISPETQVDFVRFRNDLFEVYDSKYSFTVDGEKGSTKDDMETRFLIKGLEFDQDYRDIVNSEEQCQ